MIVKFLSLINQNVNQNCQIIKLNERNKDNIKNNRLNKKLKFSF